MTSKRLRQFSGPLHKVLAPMAIMTMFGCAGTDDSGEDSTGVPTVTGDSTAKLLAANEPPPKELKTNWRQMLKTDFESWVLANNDFNPNQTDNEPATTAQLHSVAGGCGGHVTARVQSVKGARQVKYSNVGNGVVVAMIQNLGDCAALDLPLDPGQRVFWVVVRQGTQLQSLFVSKDSVVKGGTWTECPQPGHPKKDKSKAAFRHNGCGDGSAGLRNHEPQDFVSHNPRPWVTCDAGCCSSTVS